MVRVSVLELPARWNGATEALAQVDALLAEAPTDLAILPEAAFTGYVSPRGDFDLTRFAEPIDGPTATAIAALARRHRITLVAPLVLAEDERVYNTAIVAGPDGRLLATYRKRHPWAPERWAAPGPHPLPLFRVGEVLVSVAICFDGHFIEADSAEVLEQADLLAFTSAWVDEEDSRAPLLRGLARRFGIAIANANWGPGVVQVPGQGGSCVLDANGDLRALVAPPTLRADAYVERAPR